MMFFLTCVRILTGSTIRRLDVMFINAFLPRKLTKRKGIILLIKPIACTVILSHCIKIHANDILHVDHTFQSCYIYSLSKGKKNEYIIRINYQTDWNFWEGMIVMLCVYSLEKSKWVLLCCINLLRYW